MPGTAAWIPPVAVSVGSVMDFYLRRTSARKQRSALVAYCEPSRFLRVTPLAGDHKASFFLLIAPRAESDPETRKERARRLSQAAPHNGRIVAQKHKRAQQSLPHNGVTDASEARHDRR